MLLVSPFITDSLRLSSPARLRRVGWSDGLGRPLRRTAVLLDRDNVDSRNSHAAVIIKPNCDPAPARVNTRVIRAGNRIAVTATGHDGKRLKRGCGKMLAYIGGHAPNLVGATPPSKRLLGPNETQDQRPRLRAILRITSLITISRGGASARSRP